MTTLAKDKDVTFNYTDSGRPTTSSEYSTLFIVHGHTVHSGVFRHISSLAPSHSLRIICINRREYQGSTPYTPEELRIIHEGSDTERLELLIEQGVFLALFIDVLIQNLELSINDGHGAIVGWSMGNVFALTIINAISHPSLPPETSERLQTFIRTLILWDPPSELLGFDNPPQCYHPLRDQDMPKKDRNAAFGRWAASYFDHDTDAFASRDVSLLNQRNPSSRTPTTDKMSREELLSISDFRVGPKCDTVLTEPPFYGVHKECVRKAMFDSDSNVRKWGIQNICHIYGDKSSWNIVYAAWALEEMDKNNRRIKFRPIEGANHLLMWEEPELAITTLKICIEY